METVTLLWFLIDAFTHLSIELGYVWLALGKTAKYSDSFMGFIWREYGRADARWAVRDSTILSLELLTTLLLGPLCLLAAYAVYARRPYRHLLQLVISVSELYGGWMTFMPDILEGSPSLTLHDPLLLWVHLVFMNGLWLVIPGLLTWESSAVVIYACKVAKVEEEGGQATTREKKKKLVSGLPAIGWFYAVAGE